MIRRMPGWYRRSQWTIHVRVQILRWKRLYQGRQQSSAASGGEIDRGRRPILAIPQATAPTLRAPAARTVLAHGRFCSSVLAMRVHAGQKEGPGYETD